MELLQAQIAEFKEAIAALKSENKDLTEQLANANVANYDSKIKELEAAIAELNGQIESDSIAIADLNKKLAEADENAMTLQSNLEEKTKALELVEAEKDKMAKDKKDQKRKDQMCGAGLSSEKVEALYDTFSSMSDEQFDAMVATLTELKTVSPTAASTETEEEDITIENVIAEDDSDEGTVTMASDDSDEDNELSKARAGLAEWAELITQPKTRGKK